MTLADIADRLITRAQRRPPDFIVERRDGLIYLHRWWLIPRNPLLNLYLHHFVHSDDDRALHDHPWPSLSRTLRHEYREILPSSQAQSGARDYERNGTYCRRRTVRDGWLYRPARLRHRIEVSGRGAWTLFITGPVLREWGFWCRQGWLPWTEFLAEKGTGTAGCEGHMRPPRSWWRVFTRRDS